MDNQSDGYASEALSSAVSGSSVNLNDAVRAARISDALDELQLISREIGLLSRNDLTILRRMKNATTAVKNSLVATCLALGVVPEWIDKGSNKGEWDYWTPTWSFILKTDIFKACIAHSQSQALIPDYLLPHLRRFVLDPLLQPHFVTQASPVVGLLCQWTHATYTAITGREVVPDITKVKPLPKSSIPAGAIRSPSSNRVASLASPRGGPTTSATSPPQRSLEKKQPDASSPLARPLPASALSPSRGPVAQSVAYSSNHRSGSHYGLPSQPSQFSLYYSSDEPGAPSHARVAPSASRSSGAATKATAERKVPASLSPSKSSRSPPPTVEELVANFNAGNGFRTEKAPPEILALVGWKTGSKSPTARSPPRSPGGLSPNRGLKPARRNSYHGVDDNAETILKELQDRHKRAAKAVSDSELDAVYGEHVGVEPTFFPSGKQSEDEIAKLEREILAEQAAIREDYPQARGHTRSKSAAPTRDSVRPSPTRHHAPSHAEDHNSHGHRPRSRPRQRAGDHEPNETEVANAATTPRVARAVSSQSSHSSTSGIESLTSPRTPVTPGSRTAARLLSRQGRAGSDPIAEPPLPVLRPAAMPLLRSLSLRDADNPSLPTSSASSVVSSNSRSSIGPIHSIDYRDDGKNSTVGSVEMEVALGQRGDRHSFVSSSYTRSLSSASTDRDNTSRTPPATSSSSRTAPVPSNLAASWLARLPKEVKQPAWQRDQADMRARARSADPSRASSMLSLTDSEVAHSVHFEDDSAEVIERRRSRSKGRAVHVAFGRTYRHQS